MGVAAALLLLPLPAACSLLAAVRRLALQRFSAAHSSLLLPVVLWCSLLVSAFRRRRCGY